MSRQFEKFMFGTALNGWSVAKYRDGEKRILVTEHNAHDRDQKEIVFENVEAFEVWIDDVVSDDDATYNQANAVNCLINAIEGE